jgi:hypothetical protein
MAVAKVRFLIKPISLASFRALDSTEVVKH